MRYEPENQHKALTALIREVEKVFDERVSQHFAVTLYPYAYQLASAMEACESPIEQLMAMALWRWLNADSRIEIFPQRVIEGLPKAYRADFLITCADYESLPDDPEADHWGLVERIYAKDGVECDGHDFHERTKAQAQRDKARDRAFQAAGYIVLRFTGSEIWRDPDNCAFEVCRVIKTQTQMAKERGL